MWFDLDFRLRLLNATSSLMTHFDFVSSCWSFLFWFFFVGFFFFWFCFFGFFVLMLCLELSHFFILFLILCDR